MSPAMHQQQEIGPVLLRAEVLCLPLVVTGIEGDELSAHASSLPFRLAAMLTQESANVRAGPLMLAAISAIRRPRARDDGRRSGGL